jgi:nucleoid-associated protein YgaU
MPNDAKFGLVLGVVLVVVVAVVFFQRDLAAGRLGADKAAQMVNPSQPPARAPRNLLRAPKADPTSRKKATETPTVVERKHTVEAGDTLFKLAKRYYGDGDKFAELYKANREVLESPDTLPAGTVLVIPELPRADKAQGDDPPE